MIINNIKIVMLNKIIDNGYIEIENDIIKNIGSNLISNNKDIINGNGLILLPGFIDIHTHGACGIDFMDANVSDYKKIEEAFYSEGITSFLATTLTSDIDSLKSVCNTVSQAKNTTNSLLGIHLEGPYINELYKGAQNENYIREPNINELKELINISNNDIKIVTLAPELDSNMEFISYCKNNNIITSAGHTNATFDDIDLAIKSGLTNITHVHNQMSKYENRNPGVVTASMYYDDLFVECICDLIHVDKNTLKAYYKIIGNNRFMIITDSLSVKHKNIDEFMLYGIHCIKKDNACYIKDTNKLAGSILYMNQALKNMKEVCDLSLIDLAKISSYNQAKSLKLNNIGEIKIGKIADLVLLDNDFNIKYVYKNGKLVYKC